MQNAELQSMTVIQLRKLAKENGVKLSAGIDKAGIVARIAEALSAREIAVEAAQPKEESAREPESAVEAAAPVKAEEPEAAKAAPQPPKDVPPALQEASVSADVTSVAPGNGFRPWNNQEQGGYHPTYRQGWQARGAAAAPKPAWQRPANRFGPQPRPQPAAQEPARRPPEGGENAHTGRPAPASAPTLDGYRLGYRAAPQRQPYQNRSNEYGGYQNRNYQPQNQYSGYRNYQQQGGYPQNNYRAGGAYPQRDFGNQPASDVYYNDGLYRPGRDGQFTEQVESGQLPDLLQKAETEPASGILEILPDGYGFLRGKTLLPGRKDIYVSVAQIRRYGLLTGDLVEGRSRVQRESDKFAALLVVEKVNGTEAVENPDRLCFDQLAAVYPNRRIVLESPDTEDMVVRLVDLIAPIGFGQRAMMIAPPDSARLKLMCEISRAIKRNDAQAEVMMLLIDIAPEEVTEIRESVDAEVFASTFADAPDTQTRVSEIMLERAERLVEAGRNVVVLVDSLTKLTRAYQSALSQGGRPMTNTVTPAALVKPKSFFGAARNTRDAGSLTVIATIAVDTGSRVDEIIYEEFKGKANMELYLCPAQQDDPISPMIDLTQSGTKKEDMLLSDEQQEGLRSIRKVLGSATNGEAVVQLIDMMKKTKCNADLLSRLKEWIALWEKSGYLKR